MNSEPRLIEVSKGHPYYKYIRNLHYVKNKGCIGQQIHYLIFYGSELNGPIGVISGASSVYCCKPRDEYFGINKENRHDKIKRIINNIVFRLEKREKNLASRILKLWRNQVLKDWQRKYKTEPIGFETFVFGENRTGSIYKADNWNFVGMSKGASKRTIGHCEFGEKRQHRTVMTEPKMIFCKIISK